MAQDNTNNLVGGGLIFIAVAAIFTLGILSSRHEPVHIDVCAQKAHYQACMSVPGATENACQIQATQYSMRPKHSIPDYCREK